MRVPHVELVPVSGENHQELQRNQVDLLLCHAYDVRDGLLAELLQVLGLLFAICREECLVCELEALLQGVNVILV